MIPIQFKLKTKHHKIHFPYMIAWSAISIVDHVRIRWYYSNEFSIYLSCFLLAIHWFFFWFFLSLSKKFWFLALCLSIWNYGSIFFRLAMGYFKWSHRAINSKFKSNVQFQIKLYWIECSNRHPYFSPCYHVDNLFMPSSLTHSLCIRMHSLCFHFFFNFKIQSNSTASKESQTLNDFFN